MQIPSYGAAPLSATFLLTRILAVVCMVSIIGLTGNFINDIVMSNNEPPKEVVGALSVTCLAALYCLISIPYFWAQASLGLLVMTGVDSFILISFVVVAVTFGKPLSYLNCYAVNGEVRSTTAFVQSLTDSFNETGLRYWAGASKGSCFEAKAIWGFSIALCILFTTSLIMLPTLFYKSKKANGPKVAV